MITLSNVALAYRPAGLFKPSVNILSSINAQIHVTDRVAILGAPQSGKTSFIRMLCGLMPIKSGTLKRTCSISTPIGFGAASSKMTMGQYIYFVAKCYAVEPRIMREFVIDYFCLPSISLDELTSKMQPELRTRFYVAIGFSLPFDMYTVDGRYLFGEGSFKKLCHEAFLSRVETSGLIFATRDARYARQFCNRVGILVGGSLEMFSDVEHGIAFYEGFTQSDRGISRGPHYQA